MTAGPAAGVADPALDEDGGDWLQPERLAVAFGCAGPVLSDDERRLFRDARPLGFILFARNCVEPEQVEALVDDLRASIEDPFAPVLIDQEGGRVQRLKPPRWRQAPPAQLIGALWSQNRAAGREAAALNARLIAEDLAALGVTVNCTPVLDVLTAGTHRAIGDRAFGDDPEQVADLGRAVMAGTEAALVTPVIKHLPGHGRAQVDSHASLPRIDAGRAELARVDFAPFRALADAPWGIVGHLAIEAIDPERPASLSPAVIADVIRDAIGFDGVLVTDDVNMGALGGDVASRAARAIEAGCDVALHCNGDLAEMDAVAAAVGRLTAAARMRLLRAERRRLAVPKSAFDRAEATARLQQLLGEPA